MNFVDFEAVQRFFKGKTVAIVGSAPSVLDNAPGFIESHDIVVRVNNYKTGLQQGKRTDVHYSFYGTSIRKTTEELKADGVKLCMCKCPDDKPIESPWHEARHKQVGIDFRYIYRLRDQLHFWFCDTYIPTSDRFRQYFRMLNNHIPTTGFSAILDIADCETNKIYLTGFDFFSSGIHNVNETWEAGDLSDPIKHEPMAELRWLGEHAADYPFLFDPTIRQMIRAL